MSGKESARYERLDERDRKAARSKRLTVTLAAGALTLTGVAACGSDDDRGGESKGTLTVLAASSLTEAFGELEQTFESEHDVDVKVSYDSSSVLADQVIEGAPADVLATADEQTMQSVVDEDLTDGDPQTFAQNSLVIVTPPDNPANIESLQDFTDDVTFAVCVPEAPCGDAAKRLLDLDKIDADPATEEENVKDVLTKVTSGEVDAGLVYVSDAQAAGDDVATVQAENASEVVNADPIAVLADAGDTELAQEWVDLVLGDEGQQVLKSYGFQPGA
ncbi:molybdate ABC transporter substrate-binding protein [Solicola gregarius]|uniref:Molybdate ABC transporter substrate-binding protein n=1 Tax=Solicola gregarius TaxID=2908642 RepID=A0AA46TJ21_9ACTN|nr:molybdate ABC transporter substrate-binding protein [Solicola gregarius]UYM06247.1 molybdate ABC transporter substrate-binding protein [Solicola gregarius]